MVEKSRAFVDAVHLPCVWPTLSDDNNVLYVQEDLPLLTVSSSTNKLYLVENDTNFRIITLDDAVYDGPTLATNLQSKLTASGTLATSWNVTVIYGRIVCTFLISRRNSRT